MSIRPHPTKSKREPGRWWQITLGREKGRTTIVVHGSFAEAAEIERALRQEHPQADLAVVPRIKEMVLPFLDWYRQEGSERTLRDIRYTIDLYVVPWFGNLQPRQLTPELIGKFKSTLTEAGLKPVTINKHLNYLATILRWGVAHGHCREMPFKLPRFPKSKTTAEPQHPLAAAEVDALYAAIEPQYRLLFLLMADHGLRQEEAMRLTIGDIDRRRHTIRVYGKGGKYRMVPFLSDRFERELEQAIGGRTFGPLVVNPITGKPYVTIRKALDRAAVKIGLGRHVHHHLLRHTFASLAAEGGVNPHALQRFLGHASIETTNKIYTHVGRDFVGDEGRKWRERKAEEQAENEGDGKGQS